MKDTFAFTVTFMIDLNELIEKYDLADIEDLDKDDFEIFCDDAIIMEWEEWADFYKSRFLSEEKRDEIIKAIADKVGFKM